MLTPDNSGAGRRVAGGGARGWPTARRQPWGRSGRQCAWVYGSRMTAGPAGEEAAATLVRVCLCAGEEGGSGGGGAPGLGDSRETTAGSGGSLGQRRSRG